jgi:hypothetical protein
MHTAPTHVRHGPGLYRHRPTRLPRSRCWDAITTVTAVINSYATEIFRPPHATPTNEVTREGVQP